MTTSYDAAQIIGMTYNACMFFKVTNSLMTAYQVNSLYPMEYARQKDETHFYVVYKIKQGGYYYMFFEYLDMPGLPSSPTYVLTNVTYIQNALSYADYADVLAEGTPYSELEKLDPAWSYYRWYNENWGNPDYRVVVTRQLLRDGMLYVDSQPDETGVYRITGAEFYSDYQEPFAGEGDFTDMNYQIFPEDYPR